MNMEELNDLLQVQKDVVELKEQIRKQDERMEKLHQFVVDSTSSVARKKASSKAYHEELQKHFWMSSFVSFLFGVSVGVIGVGICTSWK